MVVPKVVNPRPSSGAAYRPPVEGADLPGRDLPGREPPGRDLMARMSHELRTPLNSVIGFATLLRANERGHLDERELGHVDRIIRNGQRLLTVVEEMLVVARLEAGRVPLCPAPVPLAPLVRTVVAEHEALVADRPVELRVELPTRLTPLETDGTLFRQVLVHLVANAVDFTARGAVTVRVEGDAASARPLRVVVADTGIGIAPEHHDAIFEPLVKLPGSPARPAAGAGLGLTISRALCELMGYALVVESRPGEGATFVVELTRER